MICTINFIQSPIWDTQTGDALAVLQGHEAAVWHAVFSPDGQQLATASEDKTARLWPVLSRPEMLAYAWRVLPPRLLTCEDREQLFLDNAGLTRCCFIADKNIRGSRYQGECANDRAQGQGSSEGLNRYEGGFMQGKKHGKGIYIWAEGYRYSGEFEADKLKTSLLEIPASPEGWSEIADELLRQGETEQALEALRLQAETMPNNAEARDLVCRNGGLHGHAAEVLSACEAAVRLQPENIRYRDSRGLVRALNGDMAGAIADFQAFAAWKGASEDEKKQRQAWIDALLKGEIPFTEETLTELR
ncbi:MAG: hypothetical protein GY862_22715 [Gammaproteobacteria bacterium]|nr:hypothetical protein [Gammaproteobacteria bacterium]